MIRPRQLARMGSFYLQEAILDVLCENHLEGYGIGPADLSRRLGVYRIPPMNDAIVSGYLFELQSQKKAQKAPQENDKKGKETGWRLTQKEFERRRDDI